jgi:hypothetical protein
MARQTGAQRTRVVAAAARNLSILDEHVPRSAIALSRAVTTVSSTSDPPFTRPERLC